MTTQSQRKKVISLKRMKEKKTTCDHPVVLGEEEKLSVANRLINSK